MRTFLKVIMVTLGFLFSFAPAHAEVGDMILNITVDMVIPETGSSWEYTQDIILLKEGYLLSLDGVHPSDKWMAANFSLFKNGEAIKKESVDDGDIFYFNRTIDKEEHTIIEATVYGIFSGTQTIIVMLGPVHQYSDSSTVYSSQELRNITEIHTKYEEGMDEVDLDIIFNELTRNVKTFDNCKYEGLTASLSMTGGEVRDNIWVDFFLFDLKEYRDNKTEIRQFSIEWPENKNYVTVTQSSGGETLVPERYIDIAKKIGFKNLDNEILNRTPVIVDTYWIADKHGFVVIKLKDPDSPAHTLITVDINNYSIESIEKKYWQLTFPIFFSITSNPNSSDVYLEKYSPELCGPPPYKHIGEHIGRTPFVYQYEYNENGIPASGLFSLLSFNTTGYEDEFRCININGGDGELMVSVLSDRVMEPVSVKPLMYNFSADLKPHKNTVIPAFEGVYSICALVLIYIFSGKRQY
ncbi:MAG TPA: hypothetical protein VMW53_07660 [archaeon]|nr:hypothetical protein [archaeon]